MVQSGSCGFCQRRFCATAVRQVWRDGAVFAFCQDSDPDVLLMLEARVADRDPEWHFAMGPLTSREAKGWCDQALVWSKPLIAPPNDPKRPYFVVGPFAAP